MSWELALPFSILGSAFLLVYIASQIKVENGDGEKTTFSFWKNIFKTLLIGVSFWMAFIAVQANQALWKANNINPNATVGSNPTNLILYSTQANQIIMWSGIIFIILLLILSIMDFIIIAFQLRGGRR